MVCPAMLNPTTRRSNVGGSIQPSYLPQISCEPKTNDDACLPRRRNPVLDIGDVA